jgi:hypothetical protein
MRVFPVVVLLLFCQPLLAEETSKPVDPFANQIIALKAQYGSDGIRGFFDSQIFNMEVWHEEWTRQIMMSWALLSPGAKCMNDNNWLGLLIDFTESPVDHPMNLLGWTNSDPNIFINLHHRDKTIEAHLFYPAVAHTEGRSLYPWVELDRLKLCSFGSNVQVYLRGSAGLHRETEYSVGLSYQNGSYGAKIDSQGTWSVNF